MALLMPRTVIRRNLGNVGLQVACKASVSEMDELLAARASEG